MGQQHAVTFSLVMLGSSSKTWLPFSPTITGWTIGPLLSACCAAKLFGKLSVVNAFSTHVVFDCRAYVSQPSVFFFQIQLMGDYCLNGCVVLSLILLDHSASDSIQVAFIEYPLFGWWWTMMDQHVLTFYFQSLEWCHIHKDFINVCYIWLNTSQWGWQLIMGTYWNQAFEKLRLQ